MYKNSKKKGLIFSILIICCLLIILLLAELLLYNVFFTQKRNRISEDYIILENYIDNVINTNFNMLKGFYVYVETTEDFNEENVYRYLDLLFKDSQTFIRNVGIIEDTTIIWNYPPESNRAAIGIDLSKIEDQRDLILKVKNEGISIMQGPVQLVQGGIGFIIRLPLIRNDVYFGQISIVFDGDQFYNFLSDLEKQFNVNLKINTETDIVYSKKYEYDSRDLKFSLSNDFFSWDIHVQPSEGWSQGTFWFTLIPFSIAVFSIWTGFKVYTFYMDTAFNKHNANHDSLTGLYNRHYLYKYSESLFRIAEINQYNIGIIVIDIDNFKSINDTYGHKSGDEILINFANKMKFELRAGQEIFRIGGDEFVIIFENISDKALLNSIALRFKETIKNYTFLENPKLSISISIGTSMFPTDGSNLDILYNIADEHMYTDKTNNP
ncbi:MAG: sensor domain-containing diguanylate cyclase [Clostridiales bacterium]|nr:sensor domain-containing diguanylate cyclase [Clostridiales bacterium]